MKLKKVCSVKISTLGNLVSKVTKAPLFRQDNFVNYKVLGHKITLRLIKEIKSLFLYLLDDRLRYTSCMANFIALNIGVLEPYFMLKDIASENDKWLGENYLWYPLYIINLETMDLTEAARVLLQSIIKRRCSENMQQIYRRTPMPKCDLNNIAKELCWNHT